MLPEMLLWWLVHTRFCSACTLAPEFFFEMKDWMAGQYFVATNIHLENSLGKKPSVCIPQLWVPHLACCRAVPRELSQLCSKVIK